MVKCCTVAAFIVLGIVWVLLIVSYSTYWYAEKAGDSDAYIERLYNYNQVRETRKSIFGKQSETSRYSEVYKSSYPNVIRIFQASLAFAVLSWIVTSFTLFCIILYFAGILQKIPIFKSIVKFFPIIGLLFCILSVCIFAGLQNVVYSDCKKLYSKATFYDSQGSYYANVCVEQSLFEVDDNYFRGPTTGWFTTIAAGIFSFVGIIIMLAGKALAHD
ncbi:hypothetical protein CYY_002992 [Polysphondylium violaceum]|uniref:Transmembrane protein n=1 Tax=Polysphondylium violaceum TaxID=133409 RepID=A0A8J4PZ77_9MYCE|nr:hypothetical protein CYY_002992 [Polysphondylium violaceum]